MAVSRDDGISSCSWKNLRQIDFIPGFASHIERLCLTANLPSTDPNQLCVRTLPGDGRDHSNACQNYPSSCGEDREIIHYRISTQIIGPKKTMSYIQVMVH